MSKEKLRAADRRRMEATAAADDAAYGSWHAVLVGLAPLSGIGELPGDAVLRPLFEAGKGSGDVFAGIKRGDYA